MADKKKSVLQNIANAFTNKDEIAAAKKAAAEKAAAAKAAAIAASDRALAAEKASAAKAAASQAAANKLAFEKATAERAAKMKAIEAQAALDKAVAVEAAKPKIGTVAVRSLRVRKDHSVDSSMVAGLSLGDKVTILSTWTDGKNTWANLGPDKWVAIKYDGEEMIKYD